ncbi:TPA: hypothetical protein KRM58_003520 [Clostridioides difficile]|nr:hypothetical protein [Clostridioides difficile]
MAEKQKLTASQRAQLFAQATRENRQMLPRMTATQGATTLQCNLPKARLLSKVLFDVEGVVKIKHASETTLTPPPFAPYTLIRQIRLDLNNGFAPFAISGQDIAMYNMVRLNPNIILPQKTNDRGYCYQPTYVASSAGTDNKFKFTVELPVALNERDPIGLILLQNDMTNVTLSIDIANDADMFGNKEGFEITLQNVDITPSTHTFSLPAVQEAFPDLSVIKLVNSRVESVPGNGQNIIKLDTGTIYRKIIIYATDVDGNPLNDDDINSNIELVFNQADINYSVRAETLAHINESQLGFALPKGMFIFDFAYQGIPGLGGSRDYVDTEKLTEFWIRFSTKNAGKIHVISEKLARLK